MAKTRQNRRKPQPAKTASPELAQVAQLQKDTGASEAEIRTALTEAVDLLGNSPMIRTSIDAMLLTRRLHLLCLTVIETALTDRGVQNPHLAMRILATMVEVAEFTVPILKAECATKIAPFFDELELYRFAIPESELLPESATSTENADEHPSPDLPGDRDADQS